MYVSPRWGICNIAIRAHSRHPTASLRQDFLFSKNLCKDIYCIVFRGTTNQAKLRALVVNVKEGFLIAQALHPNRCAKTAHKVSASKMICFFESSPSNCL